MKTIQKNIRVGYQVTNEDNNHRILCVEISDNKALFIGFIGKDIVKADGMTMKEAFKWLYTPVKNADTICDECGSALCLRRSVVAAQGHLFCSYKCARSWKRRDIESYIDDEVAGWVTAFCEDVAVDDILED